MMRSCKCCIHVSKIPTLTHSWVIDTVYLYLPVFGCHKYGDLRVRHIFSLCIEYWNFTLLFESNMLAVDENTVLFKTFYFKAKVLFKILNYIYIFVYHFKLVLIFFPQTIQYYLKLFISKQKICSKSLIIFIFLYIISNLYS